MRVLVILRPKEGVTLDQFVPLLEAEEKVLWKYLSEGHVRSISYAQDIPGTIVLDFESEDASQAERLASDFPLVQAGLFDTEVISLAPYQGLATLFDGSHGISMKLPSAWQPPK